MGMLFVMMSNMAPDCAVPPLKVVVMLCCTNVVGSSCNARRSDDDADADADADVWMIVLSWALLQ